MANQEQQTGQAPDPSQQAQLNAGLSARGLARRRFTRAGLAASGALVTVTNAAGMGTHAACASPSGSLSGGLHSHTPETPELCGGLSPGGWKKPGGANDTWPIDEGTKFGTVFGCSGATAFYANYTLLEVMSPQEFKKNGQKDDYEIGAHMVASLLNVLSGKVTVLTVPVLKTIWDEYTADGTYSPAAGVNWGGGEIVAYILTTFHN